MAHRLRDQPRANVVDPTTGKAVGIAHGVRFPPNTPISAPSAVHRGPHGGVARRSGRVHALA
jgi:hypothetical protein